MTLGHARKDGLNCKVVEEAHVLCVMCDEKDGGFDQEDMFRHLSGL
jgi:hypothetical protein